MALSRWVGALCTALLFVIALGVAPSAQAATLYWVGGAGDGVTVNANDWSTANPGACADGAGNGTVPGASDIAVFDPDCDNSAAIGATWSVAGIDIQTGYAGTVSQTGATAITVGSSNFAAAGNFTGGSGTIDINGNLTITGGTFTSTSGIMTLSGNLNRSAGTFTHNSGTVTFDGAVAQTLTGETFSALTINNSHATPNDTNDVDSSAAVTVAGVLTVTDGQFQPTTASDFNGAISIGAAGILKPDASATVTAAGNWTNAGTFTHNSGTVNFDASSGTQTLTSGGTSAAFAFNALTHSGAGTLQLATNALQVDGAFINSAGTYNANALATTVTGLTTVSGGVYSASTATQTHTGGLTVSGGTLTGSTGAIDVNGVLTLSSGTLTAPSGTFTVSGNLVRSGGTFTPGTGTVTLDGSDQTISGSTTFYNLTKTASSPATLTFTAGTNQTVTNTLSLNGTNDSTLLTLRSSSGGTAWSIEPQTTRTVSYLDVKDSTNAHGTTIECVTGCVDSGNNTRWAFAAATTDTGNGGGGGGGGGSDDGDSEEETSAPVKKVVPTVSATAKK